MLSTCRRGSLLRDAIPPALVGRVCVKDGIRLSRLGRPNVIPLAEGAGAAMSPTPMSTKSSRYFSSFHSRFHELRARGVSFERRPFFGVERAATFAFSQHARVRSTVASQPSQPQKQQPQKGTSDSCSTLESAVPATSATAPHESASTASQSSDTPPPSTQVVWVDRWLPASWRPYAYLARIDKPIGTHLLFWPCAWSIGLACLPNFPDWRVVALFGTGAILLRGAGCTINDLWDRNIDKQVERTKTRPLAAGDLSVNQAVVFLGAQLLLGLCVLTQFNMNSILLGLASMPIVIVYPLMKRVTFWPQLILGLAFNWGALLGWTVIQNSLNLSVCGPLYAAGISWTLIYDTIYAHQDKIDDARVGVKSTALRFGARTMPILAIFSVGMIGALTVAGWNAGVDWPYYAAVAGSAGHLAWQLTTTDLSNPRDCFAKFASNRWIGIAIFAGIVGSAAWHAWLKERRTKLSDHKGSI